MDAILQDLGVAVESEAEAFSSALRNKVLEQLSLNDNPLLLPNIPAQSVPKLSADSILRLSRRLLDDFKEKDVIYRKSKSNDDAVLKRAKAIMKLRFFESLIKGGDAKIAELRLFLSHVKEQAPRRSIMQH